MTTDYTLLPPNATALERAMERAMRPGQDVLDGVALVRTAKEVLPDGWPLYLVWEYGLEELLPYLPDPRVILTTGLQWQRIKGTPASVLIALGWLAMAATVEQETATSRHWYEFQVDPGRIPTRDELVNLVGLARLSAPVGTRLSRVFHGYDLRRAIYDYTAWSDGSLYSDHSGVFDPDLGLDVSFGGITNTGVALGEVATACALTILHATATKYVDRPMWDFVAWGDGPPILNHRVAVLATYTMAGSAAVAEAQAHPEVVTRSLAYEQYSWGSGTWGATNWTQPQAIDG